MAELNKFDRINAIIFLGNAMIEMIEEVGDQKPFTFIHVKDLMRKLIMQLEKNSDKVYNKNDSEVVVEYAIEFQHLLQYLVKVAMIVNFRLERNEAIRFQEEFYDLINKYNIEVK